MTGGVLVHEWLASVGGSEKVFDAIVEAFPDEDILCLWSDVAQRYPERRFQETWLARSPLRRNKIAAIPFIIPTWRRHSGEYEWALASTHMFAHHVSFRNQPNEFRKYVYVHSPARYVWEPDLDGRGDSRFARTAAAPIKWIDRRRAKEITAAAANSEFVRARVLRAWDVDCEVIYPPVDVCRIQRVADWRDSATDDEKRPLEQLPCDFLLGASRLVPYKTLDTVIDVGATVGLPVVIAGEGPERSRLEAHAREVRVPAVFLGRVSDELLFALYQRCVAFVFPAIEDFGIMPVEAMAAGAPVLCGVVGGVLETVAEGISRAQVDFRDRQSIAAGVGKAAALRGEGPRLAARRFGRDRFATQIRTFVGSPTLFDGSPAQ